MARQGNVIKDAVRDAVRVYDSGNLFPRSRRCGMNLAIEIPFSEKLRKSGTIVMSSYGTEIAYVSLADRDESGHVPVKLSAYYYNYSRTTSRHLTCFLTALSDAGLIGQDVFDRRANRRNVEARAIEALHANNDNRYTAWFTL